MDEPLRQRESLRFPPQVMADQPERRFADYGRPSPYPAITSRLSLATGAFTGARARRITSPSPIGVVPFRKHRLEPLDRAAPSRRRRPAHRVLIAEQADLVYRLFEGDVVQPTHRHEVLHPVRILDELTVVVPILQHIQRGPVANPKLQGRLAESSYQADADETVARGLDPYTSAVLQQVQRAAVPSPTARGDESMAYTASSHERA